MSSGSPGRYASLSLIGIGVFLVTLATLAACAATSGSTTTSGSGCGAVGSPTVTMQPTATSPPTDTPTPPIIIHVALPSTGGSPTPDVGVTPSATPPCLGSSAIVAPVDEAKVIAYLQTNALPQSIINKPSGPIKVAKITTTTLMTYLQGDTVDVTDEVWYAEVPGTFQFAGPPGANTTGAIVYPYGFAVFDDTTGNLLLYGGLNQPNLP